MRTIAERDSEYVQNNRKTYNSLNVGQIKELANLVWNGEGDWFITREDGHVKAVYNNMVVVFNAGGLIHPHTQDTGRVMFVNNIFKIVSKCLAWGVSYQ